jgi:hypothetical protein
MALLLIHGDRRYAEAAALAGRRLAAPARRRRKAKAA